MTVSERIRQFSDYMGITIKGFEKAAGLSNGYVKRDKKEHRS